MFAFTYGIPIMVMPNSDKLGFEWPMVYSYDDYYIISIGIFPYDNVNKFQREENVNTRVIYISNLSQWRFSFYIYRYDGSTNSNAEYIVSNNKYPIIVLSYEGLIYNNTIRQFSVTDIGINGFKIISFYYSPGSTTFINLPNFRFTMFYYNF